MSHFDSSAVAWAIYWLLTSLAFLLDARL